MSEDDPIRDWAISFWIMALIFAVTALALASFSHAQRLTRIERHLGIEKAEEIKDK